MCGSPRHKICTASLDYGPLIDGFVCRLDSATDSVLSCNPQSTNSGANWLRSGTYSTLLLWPSSPSLEFHWPLATVLPLHAVRLTAQRRNQRVQAGQRPSPAGYCLSPTAELSTSGRGPISTNEPSILSMSPNRAIRPDKVKIENPRLISTGPRRLRDVTMVVIRAKHPNLAVRPTRSRFSSAVTDLTV